MATTSLANDNEESAGRSQGNAHKRKSPVRQADVPGFELSEALRIAQAIADNYGKAPTKPLHIAAALNMAPGSGHFRMLCGASSAYGLTEGSYASEVIALTELGRRIVAPTVEGGDFVARREAFLRPRVIREFLMKYNGSRVPPEKIAVNVLEQLEVPVSATGRTFKLIVGGATELGLLREIKGQLWVDLDNIVADDMVLEDTSLADTEIASPLKLLRSDSSGSGGEAGKSAASSPSENNRVFITHGRNKEIVGQLKELLTFGKFHPVISEENETVSKPVPDKVLDDMRSCYAAIIHAGREVKLLDEEGKEHTLLNQNVLIEIGAAMALYGRRFILLVEDGAVLPSNLQGLYEVRYRGDRLDYEATMKLLRAFNDFKS